jgi:hypothetical protein
MQVRTEGRILPSEHGCEERLRCTTEEHIDQEE